MAYHTGKTNKGRTAIFCLSMYAALLGSRRCRVVDEFINFIPKDFIEFNMHFQSLLDTFLDQCSSLHNSARGVFKGNSVGSTSNVLEVE